VGLERGPLSLVSTTEELLDRKSNGSGLENRDYGSRRSVALTTWSVHPQKLALSSPTSGVCSVGIVRSRTQTTLSCFHAEILSLFCDTIQGQIDLVDCSSHRKLPLT
jgi:hypothetical protein